MTTLLVRTRAAVDDCEQHLKDTGASGTEIEAYLTQYVLVVMCAEIEQAVHSILERRVAGTADPDLTRFALSSGQRVLRSVSKNELAGFVGRFGDHAKEKLDSLLDETEVTLYNNAVKARHDIAHSRGATLTFSELLKALEVADKVIDAVNQAMNHKSSVY